MKPMKKPNSSMTLKDIKEEIAQMKYMLKLKPEERYFVLEESGLPEYIFMCYNNNNTEIQ